MNQRSTPNVLNTIEDIAKKIAIGNQPAFDDAAMLSMIAEEVLPDMVDSLNNNTAVKLESIATLCGVCAQILARGITEYTNSADTTAIH